MKGFQRNTVEKILIDIKVIIVFSTVNSIVIIIDENEAYKDMEKSYLIAS